MSSFTAPLVLEALPTTRKGRGEFLVYIPFAYDVGFEGSGDTIIVPAGYNTDLCSVPFFARAFIPLAGKIAKPALLHDWLLDQKSPRAHDIFNEALKVAGVKNHTRFYLVLSVRFYAKFKKLMDFRIKLG